MLSRVRIVLVNTSHPGNIGSAARAMKTMGLSQLVLVGPKSFPDPKAVELSAGAEDILEAAVVVDTLAEALTGCQCVIATSARSRDVPLPYLNPRQAGERLALESQSSEVAIVFGRESSGLNNQELLHCHYHMMIPANPEYSSLNLAAAVQVLCYEVRMAHLNNPDINIAPLDEFASSEDVERFYAHLEKVLIDIKFLKPRSPKRLMPRLRRLFNRQRLEKMEVSMLRGILTAVENHLEN